MDDLNDNDELVFLDEDVHQELDVKPLKQWNILIVDDDEEVHTVTQLALTDLIVKDRELNFIHAYSGVEAKTLLEKHGRDIAIILLDVVMESDSAGLNVVEYLRDTLKYNEPRVILRTGQPGFAPEEDIIKTYDINDYKTKTELTRSKLLTAVIASIRSYQQILIINQSRLGLQKIIQSSANLLEEHSIKGFCEGVVTQISSLIGLEAEGVVCAKAGTSDQVYILGAAGEYAAYINEPLNVIHNAYIVENVSRCLRIKQHIFESGKSVLFLNSSGFEAAVYINLSHELDDLDKQLIEVFMASIAVGYENVNLFHELTNAAFRDWLTRLPNRNEFINILGRRSNYFPDKKLCAALIDINQFSDINDGLGQEAGNELLITVAQRLNEYFGEKVEKSRIAADVFGLLGGAEEITPQAINKAFEQPFRAGDNIMPLNVTIGLCELGDTPEPGVSILKRTNIALNRAKKQLTSSFEYFAPEIEEQTTKRLAIIRRLRSDFSSRKLELWFQPQVSLSNEAFIGMEGLLRWPDGSGGYISPAEFVPLAEYSGLIVDIGYWVLEESCKRLKQLAQHGHPTLTVAVNVSIPQFRDPHFTERVIDILTSCKIEPSLLELEITESIVMDEPQIVIDALRELKKHGVMIAIDDFGTGFSSMSYLQKLPLDRLKVDRSFISEIKPGQSPIIAETIVTLGNKLGLHTIAEGIEKREQASFMIKLGCDEAQGYLFGRPMPFNEIVELLNKQSNLSSG